MKHVISLDRPPAAASPAVPQDNTDPQVLLRVSGLKVHFPIRESPVRSRRSAVVHAVDGVDLEIRKGETLGLVGESGCGKSTTGRAIIQLEQPTAGTAEFDGTDLTTLSAGQMRKMRRRIQMIFQDPYGSLDPRMTVGRSIREPLEVHQIGRAENRDRRTEEMLELVGLSPAFEDRYPHELSGGQRQRIGIARALAAGPELVVADEPVSALDVSIQAQIVTLLDELQDRLQLTYLFIAHDLAVVRHISDRVAVMYLGRIVEISERDDLYQRPRHPYTVALLSAVPIIDPKVEASRRHIILGGDVPNPVVRPSGCHFHTRCWLRERLGNPSNCATEAPQLRPTTPGHSVACHWSESMPADVVASAVPASAGS